ncbi:MAG: sugar transferase [Planctomycetaceae bacterium]
MEYLSAIVLLVLAAPFVAIAAILVKLTSRGPVFYRQTRLGRDGRPFRLIKMRTMVHEAEKESGPVWSTADDPRITPVGRFLRETHIDEFPQLVNVLLGQMALIGPRPERPEIAESLEWQVPDFPQRLNVRPGITGLAQLKLPPDSDLEGVHKKVRHDLYYVRYLGPWLDLRIMAATAWLLVKTMFRGAWRYVSLPSEEKVYLRADRLGSQQAKATVEPCNQEGD